MKKSSITKSILLLLCLCSCTASKPIPAKIRDVVGTFYTSDSSESLIVHRADNASANGLRGGDYQHYSIVAGARTLANDGRWSFVGDYYAPIPSIVRFHNWQPDPQLILKNPPDNVTEFYSEFQGDKLVLRPIKPRAMFIRADSTTR